MSAQDQTPPGCEPVEGGGAYVIKDVDTFLDAIRPAVEAGLAHVHDAEEERSGEGWHGRMTCSACPVQIEGEVDGHAFYFRARWDSWSFGVSRDKLTPENGASFDEVYRRRDTRHYPRSQAIGGPYAYQVEGDAEGDGEMAGSWMPYSEAWRHIEDSIAKLRAQRTENH